VLSPHHDSAQAAHHHDYDQAGANDDDRTSVHHHDQAGAHDDDRTSVHHHDQAGTDDHDQAGAHDDDRTSDHDRTSDDDHDQAGIHDHDQLDHNDDDHGGSTHHPDPDDAQPFRKWDWDPGLYRLGRNVEALGPGVDLLGGRILPGLCRTVAITITRVIAPTVRTVLLCSCTFS